MVWSLITGYMQTGASKMHLLLSACYFESQKCFQAIVLAIHFFTCLSELFVDYFYAADKGMSGKVSKETLADALKHPNIGPGIPADEARGLADRVF